MQHLVRGGDQLGRRGIGMLILDQVGQFFVKAHAGHGLGTREDILRQDICKINCRMMENEDTHDLVAYLEEHKDVFVNAPSGKGLFEITDAKTNKATAVRWLAEYLNVTKDEVAVYGDGGNDLDMLAMFPHSYAPAAAQERAKTAASAVIGPYEEYSVARHMEKLLLLQK